jgi:PKD repeat protein
MKKITLFILASIAYLFSFSQVDINQLFSQHPELIIKFQIEDRSQLETLTRMVSIDKVTENEVIAYTSQKEFEHFLTLNIPYEIVERPVLTPEELNMLDFEAIKNYRNDWNYYPTYQAYLDLMDEFVTNYPEICRKVEFGTTVQGRKLWALENSKNVHVREAEPQVFLTSTMHGDETCGYVLMLRYIDYLLSNYEGADERVTYLLDNMEIWVNPLANPDGTYWGGNNSVSGSRRGNANNKDLNRNYYDDTHNGNVPPGAGPLQQETAAFIALQQEEHFTLAVNIHGGEEVCNYPWDNKTASTADNNWWVYVCREYADTVHVYNSNYMNGFSNGIVRGCTWYMITGGRQDYANYYNHTREFCLEISSTWTTPAAQLPNHWNWNHRSFLNYTQQALYGIHGVVTDACSGEPVHAKIFVNSHDVQESYVMTDPRVGYYARPIKGGTYSITYSAAGYVPQTVSITVADKQKAVQNISLAPEGMDDIFAVDFEADVTEISVNETVQFTDISEDAISWEWFFEGGMPETSTEQNAAVLYKNPGSFNVKLKASNGSCSNEKLMEGYILVAQVIEPPVANFEADKTEIFEKDTVKFKDLSENTASWEWYFEGGTPETSAEQNPVVVYEKQGTFNVTLKVTNDFGSDEMGKENYIIVNTLAINEIEGINVKIFPNPVSPETTLTIDAELPVYKIEMINLLGAIVKTSYPNAASCNFSVSGIEKGIYLLRIETPKGVSATKIQVQ